VFVRKIIGERKQVDYPAGHIYCSKLTSKGKTSMTKQRFPSSVQVAMAMVIFLLVATGDSLAQPAPGSLTGSVDLKNEGQVLSNLGDIINPNAAYFIKSKGSQKVIEVRGGSLLPGAVVQQIALSGNLRQKFSFTEAGGGFFFIRSSTGGHFVTFHPQPGGTLDPGTLPPEEHPSLTQERPSSDPQNADAQKWRVVESGERGCFLILSKTDQTRALQPTSASESARLTTVPRDGNNLQKWILKVTTKEDHPDVTTAETGLVSDCTANLKADLSLGLFTVNLKTVKQPISPIFPEWRSVGEDFPVDGIRRRPLHSYKILEGVVSSAGSHVSTEDTPAGHFTHDLNFDVIPDPPFRYLLGRSIRKIPFFPDREVVQSEIEVEWESGLAQGDRKDNPAAAASRRGDSFGFYTAGHERRDVIWNWPTANDWVHVEGVWVFDRGHDNPVRTEIHPPHFVAVKRDLPDRFEPKPNELPGQFVFATRADIFANGDGNIVWNNKRIHDFAQPVKMSERVYTVIFKHDLPRPTPTAKLKVGFKRQRGDSYTGRPIIEVFENGTPDVPTPHVMMSISWAGDRVPDTAVFARTLFVYWDDLPTHGVRSDFEIKKVTVTLQKVVINDKSEGDDFDVGEYRLFADVGGRWRFLNEFVGVNDIIDEGLGGTWDKFFSAKHFIPVPGGFLPIAKPSGAEFEYTFNQTTVLYLPPRKSFRVSVGGWEGDYLGGKFGKVLNPYSPCPEAIRFVESEFNGNTYKSHGGYDDPAGEATRVFTFRSVGNAVMTVPSGGGKTPDPEIGDNNADDNFRLTFSVRVSRP
jgi:hypothetical protein